MNEDEWFFLSDAACQINKAHLRHHFGLTLGASCDYLSNLSMKLCLLIHLKGNREMNRRASKPLLNRNNDDSDDKPYPSEHIENTLLILKEVTSGSHSVTKALKRSEVKYTHYLLLYIIINCLPHTIPHHHDHVLQ